MKISELAKKCGVTYQTARRWWERGYLNAERLPNGTVIVDSGTPFKETTQFKPKKEK